MITRGGTTFRRGAPVRAAGAPPRPGGAFVRAAAGLLRGAALVLAAAALLGPRPGAAKSPALPRVASVRAVDWRNFTYPSPLPACPKCLGAGALTLVGGRTVPDPIFTDLEAHLVAVGYGDVAGGPADEALVEVFWRFSPKGTTTRYYLFALREQRPVVLWSGYRLSYEDETAGILTTALARRGLVAEDADSSGRRWRLSFAGTPDGKLKLVKRQRLKPPRSR